MYIEILVEKDSYEIVHTKSAGTWVLSQTWEMSNWRREGEGQTRSLELAAGQQAMEKKVNYASYLVHLLKEHF